jgi:hypothetical protein
VSYLSDRRLFQQPLAGDEVNLWLRLEAQGQTEGADPIDRHLQLLRVRAGLEAGEWDPLCAALRGSRLAALRPLTHGWRFDWCLPAWKDLEAGARGGLDQLGVEVDRDNRPIPATPLLPWTVDRVGVPRILVLPYDDPTLSWDDGVTAGVDATPNAISSAAWATLLRGTFDRLARARLPDFVTTRYSFVIDDDGVPWFVRRQGATRVKPTDMAAGFRMWVDLALLDGWEVLGALGRHLTAILSGTAGWPEEPATARLLYHLYHHGQDLEAATNADPEATVDLVAAAPALAQGHVARSLYSESEAGARIP